ncbi:succinate dehydrogenase subunit C [Nitrosomonas cryotolerans]|uniref:Succinate dehydrogenase cytochrome b556 subunit n=1 Tax=Nitrosomonas cryotolerans ATCC 49181 TaxID=1131553 RepID=A0A1N6J6D5_9PROT|nr:succinate dehydrogenase, cytochrome b556 subunit [Nitrosomonas cryotolerans]SFP45530.1 succinate dehydrogenase subunit C [Nitrosomonas cryotolerans]SIO39825.1 succinate dehydrogenase subunit C [Nitrosomonas cryotolerans ATCC 49181]
MEAKLQNKRPKHLNLFKIRQPLPAVISILHRVSGILLFFPGIPLLLYGLQMMLDSRHSYEVLTNYLHSPTIKGVLIFSLWFFLHHLCAGIRFLALDLHYGVMLRPARMSSKLVLVFGIILTLLIGFAIW